jgi:hypothetical protein
VDADATVRRVGHLRFSSCRSRLAGVAVLALAGTLTPVIPHAYTAPAAAAVQTSRVKALTWNVYVGARVKRVIDALVLDPSTVPSATATAWAEVRATRPYERMNAIAAKIAATRPMAVGLQEVARWTTFDESGTPLVRIDFLDLLLNGLARRGVDYRVVKGAVNRNLTLSRIPIASGGNAATLSFFGRNVILRRGDVRATTARRGTFQNLARFVRPNGSTLSVRRGWGSVDLRIARARFRFVNTHLEAFNTPEADAETLRRRQLSELFAAQRSIARSVGGLPRLYVGDYNSIAPGGGTYQRLVKYVGSDVWATLRPGEAGYTCCFDYRVRDPRARLKARIDFVVSGAVIRPRRVRRLGASPVSMTPSGRWPSDHAGVLAQLAVPRA